MTPAAGISRRSKGYPILGVELRIVDEIGRELPWDGKTMGELQVRGPWIIRQYFKRDATTDYMTKDGWFRTGDVVTMSPDGYMTITDRTKDLVKSGGEWISTVELENAIIGHPEGAGGRRHRHPRRTVVRAPDGVRRADTGRLGSDGRGDCRHISATRRRQVLGAREGDLHRRGAEDQRGQVRQESAAPPVRRGAVGLNALKWCAIGTQSLGDTDSARIMRLERINVWATGSVLFS
jgi:acyl-CoA synthetase (AMP-forming)/AMP-acid ligase II